MGGWVGGWMGEWVDVVVGAVVVEAAMVEWNCKRTVI